MTLTHAFDRLHQHLLTWGHDVHAVPESLACRVTDPEELGLWHLNFEIRREPLRLQLLAQIELGETTPGDLNDLVHDLNAVNLADVPGVFAVDLDASRALYRAFLRLSPKCRGIARRADMLLHELHHGFAVLSSTMRARGAGDHQCPTNPLPD